MLINLSLHQLFQRVRENMEKLKVARQDLGMADFHTTYDTDEIDKTKEAANKETKDVKPEPKVETWRDRAARGELL